MKSIPPILPVTSTLMVSTSDRRKAKDKTIKQGIRSGWLIANNYGQEGQTVPDMSDEWVSTISQRYIELYEHVIGEKFIPQDLSEEETNDRIVKSLEIRRHLMVSLSQIIMGCLDLKDSPLFCPFYRKEV